MTSFLNLQQGQLTRQLSNPVSINTHLLSFIQCEYLRLRDESGDIRADSDAIEHQLRQQPLSTRQAIGQRAEHLLSTEEKAALLTPARQYRQLSITLLGIFAIFGGLATVEVFSGIEQASANFFWILLALLGINAASLLLWLLLIIWPNSGDASDSWIMSLHAWLSRLRSKDNLALQAWQRGISQPGSRQWHLSVISHGLWLAFLAGTLVMAWLLLSTRQFDFFWETTILSSDTFVTLSHWLTTLPRLLGIALPTSDQVMSSRLGGSPQNPEALRILWSNLLLSSLVLYGLVPRAIALLAAISIRRRYWNKLSPDLSSPYYYELAMRLTPSTSSEGIVDKDWEPCSKNQGYTASITATVDRLLRLPGICLAGLECDGKWPPELTGIGLRGLSATLVSVNAVDRSSRQQLLADAGTVENIILLARFEAAPDRGIVRFIRELNGQPATLWLLLIEQETQTSDRQWHDWLSAAAKAQLQPQQLCRLSRETTSDGQ